jgi:imidazolonepropionase-like amidohydrolase
MPARDEPLITIACAAALTLSVLLVTAAAAMAQWPATFVLTGATLIDGTGRPPLDDAVIVIEAGRISRVGPRATTPTPANATIIDGRGKFVIPGLADMHNHLQNGSIPGPPQDLVSNLSRLTSLGITTVFNPSVPLAEFARLRTASAQTPAAARFFGTGPIVTVKGDFFGAAVGAPTPATPAEAIAVVNTLKAAGVDAIKTQRDDFGWASTFVNGLMPLDVLTALVQEAHRQGLKVFVHAPKLALAREALTAGVDGLMHGIIDEPIDEAFLALMKTNGAVYVSTQGLFEDVADIAAWTRRLAPYWEQAALQPPDLPASLASPAAVKQFQFLAGNAAFTRGRLGVARGNLKKVFDAGVPIVLGTDTGFVGVLIGVSTYVELELLVEAGLRPQDAIRAATLNAAGMIGREKDLGSVEAGKLADLVILDAKPLEDIRNVRKIYRTVKGGVVYEPAAARQP